MTLDELDEALADPAVDHPSLAARLGVDADELQRAAEVRKVLLEGRPPGGDVPDLDLNYLTTAGLGASHLTAYIRVTEQLAA